MFVQANWASNDFFFASPGVTITELQKRGGLNDQAYANVSQQQLFNTQKFTKIHIIIDFSFWREAKRHMLLVDQVIQKK